MHGFHSHWRQRGVLRVDVVRNSTKHKGATESTSNITFRLYRLQHFFVVSIYYWNLKCNCVFLPCSFNAETLAQLDFLFGLLFHPSDTLFAFLFALCCCCTLPLVANECHVCVHRRRRCNLIGQKLNSLRLVMLLLLRPTMNNGQPAVLVYARGSFAVYNNNDLSGWWLLKYTFCILPGGCLRLRQWHPEGYIQR